MSNRPNLLIIMSDEHAPMFSGAYGHPLVQTPNLDRLAAEGVLFESAYTNSPVCVPSRMSFMTGQYVRRIGTYDNTTCLSSDIPTWAHLLRAAGYDAVLAGKMHFRGPDQLHGFRARLARDLHAEEFHPTWSWEEGTPPAADPWPALYKAGPGTSEVIEVDDQVEEAAHHYLRSADQQGQPWSLTVSFNAPHFPLIVPERFWNLYPVEQIDLPVIPPGHLETQHPVYQRMRRMFGLIDYPEDLIRRGRAGYYGLITYLDEKIGRLLQTLDEIGQAENTLVVYTSDHGEMAGEHGMWRKSNFYEQSCRVPLVLRWPDQLPAGQRVREHTSLVDLAATIAEISGTPSPRLLDGDSLLPLARGDAADWKDEVFAEYLGHGVARPIAMLRRGRYKLNYSLDDPLELYDLETDPGEFTNLAEDSRFHAVREELRTRLLDDWNPVALEKQVRQSQRDRLLIIGATGDEPAYVAKRRDWEHAGAVGVPPA